MSKVLLQESLFVCEIWVRNEKKMVFNLRRKSTFQWEPFFVGCQLEIQVSLVLWPIFCCFCPSLVQTLREHRPTWKGKSSRSEKKEQVYNSVFWVQVTSILLESTQDLNFRLDNQTKIFTTLTTYFVTNIWKQNWIRGPSCTLVWITSLKFKSWYDSITYWVNFLKKICFCFLC